jgi:hypothetical protein
MAMPDFDRAATLVAQLFDSLPSLGGPACTISYVVEAIIKKAQEHGFDSGPEGPVAGTLHWFLVPLVEAYGKDMVQASLDHDALVEGVGEVARLA